MTTRTLLVLLGLVALVVSSLRTVVVGKFGVKSILYKILRLACNVTDLTDNDVALYYKKGRDVNFILIRRSLTKLRLSGVL